MQENKRGSLGLFGKRLQRYLLSFLLGMIVVAGMLFGMSLSTAARSAGIDSWMPNQQLQNLVLYDLNQQYKKEGKPVLANVNEITQDNIKDLKSLIYFPGTGAQDPILTEPVVGGNGSLGPTNPGNYSLEGLQYATNLETINMNENLNYQHQFFRNDITDVTPLSKLDKLQTLELSGNRITDITPVANLPKLTKLNVMSNCIADLSSLDGKKFTNGLSYIGQQVVLPLVYAKDNAYKLTEPFINKLPKNARNPWTGQTLVYDQKNLAVATGGGIGYRIDARNGSDSHVQVFRISGAASVSGDNFNYNNLKTQIKPGIDTTDPWGNDAQVVRNPYTYYLIAQYRMARDSVQVPVIEYLIPYESTAISVDYVIVPVDQDGKPIAGLTPKKGSGLPGDVIEVPAYDGYETSTKKVTIPENGGNINVVYSKKSTGGDNGNTGNGGGTGTTPGLPSTPIGPANPVEPSKPEPPTTPEKPSEPETPPTNPDGGIVAKKNQAAYAVNKIYLYQKPTFNKKQRLAYYTKKPRINRPMFVVTDYAKSKNGALRYKVKDVNHKSATAGKTGYITANSKYVLPVYYQGKHRTITVINPKGVNLHRQKNLANKIKNYKQGTVLKVKRLETHNLTTRFVLTNGGYVTANRKLVIAGHYKFAKQVKAKGAINRYSNVNLTKKNRQYSKKTQKVFKVKRAVYSRTHDMTQRGTLRYQVAGGYITGNAKYVKIIR